MPHLGSSDDDDADLDLLLAADEVLGDRYITTALLQHQYFPRVKKDGEEFPPILSSESFNETVAEAIVKSGGSKPAAWVELRARRFDGLVRRIGIPHPVPYSWLVLHLRDRWGDIAPKLDNEKSQIRPKTHPDRRVIQMDYIDHADQHEGYTRLAQGRQYLASADISNCFPSIYSHALDWALRGKDVAKKDRTGGSWQAKVDKYSRNCVNGETKGLLIGPAVSNVLAELVLQRVDELLPPGTPYIRYIDDYSAYFATREEAEEFLAKLQRALADFRLDLNTRKTRIKSLREGVGDAWRAEVLSHLPADDEDLSVARFLQQAELIALRYPSESVLKFAAKTVLGRPSREFRGSLFVTDELVRITQFHPHLLPILSRQIDLLGRSLSKTERERLALVFRAQLDDAVRRTETDAISWLLYILRIQLRRPLHPSSVKGLIETNDDLVWIALAVMVPPTRGRIAAHVKSLPYSDGSDREAHWLARYELWRAGLLKNATCTKDELQWMRVLKRHQVKFSKL